MTAFKPFYNDHLALTHEARWAFEDVHGEIAVIFDRLLGKGYSPRDIGHYLTQSVGHVEAVRALEHGAKVRNARPVRKTGPGA